VLGLVRLYPHQVLRFELKRLRFLLVNAVYLAKTGAVAQYTAFVATFLPTVDAANSATA
jgi:hypothetical protein